MTIAQRQAFWVIGLVIGWVLPLGLCRAESKPATAPVVHSTAFTPALKKAFLDQAEQSLRTSAKVSADFWKWLDAHPVIREGLLCSDDPVPPEFAENLDELRIALPPARAERYQHLILGVSLGKRWAPAPISWMDGAYNATAYAAPAGEIDEKVKVVAEYISKNKLTLADAAGKIDSILDELKLPELKKKDRRQFIDQLAFLTHTYPQRVGFSVPLALAKLIDRYETVLPAFKDKGPQWPMFPLDKTPWPLLAPMRQTSPERELDYLWDRFNGKFDAKRFYTYGRYSWDYEKPEVKFKVSDWHPNALPRIIEDGGVCGRLSTLAQLGYVGLGQPAVGMYQPGHRALMRYSFNAKTGRFTVDRMQGISGPDRSTSQWFLPAPDGPRVSKNEPKVGIEWHFALASSMNVGLDQYVQSRIAQHLAKRCTEAQRDQKLALLESALRINPYNLEAWYAQADLLGADTLAVNELLVRMTNVMFSPGLSSAEEEVSADTDLTERLAKQRPADVREQSNVIVSVAGTQILNLSYQKALDDKAHLAEHRQHLRTELARREQLKLDGEGVVPILLDRFDVAIEGPDQLMAKVLADVKSLESLKPKQRGMVIDQSAARVALICAVAKKNAAPTDWLASVYGAFPATLRFEPTKDGPVKPNGLFNDLRQRLVKAYRSTGPKGAAAAKQVETEFQAARDAADVAAKEAPKK